MCRWNFCKYHIRHNWSMDSWHGAEWHYGSLPLWRLWWLKCFEVFVVVVVPVIVIVFLPFSFCIFFLFFPCSCFRFLLLFFLFFLLILLLDDDCGDGSELNQHWSHIKFAWTDMICIKWPFQHVQPKYVYHTVQHTEYHPKTMKIWGQRSENPAKKKTELWTGRKIPGSVSQVYLFVLGNWWLSYTSIRYYTIMFPLAECALNLFAKCSLNRVRHQARVPCFAKLCCTKHLGMIWISICVWETFGVSDHYTNWKVGGAILTVSSGGAILTVGSGQSSKGLIISQCMSYCKQGVRWFCCIFF